MERRATPWERLNRIDPVAGAMVLAARAVLALGVGAVLGRRDID